MGVCHRAEEILAGEVYGLPKQTRVRIVHRRDRLVPLRQTGGMSGAAPMPAQLTSFIGRSHELAELGTLFDRARLITLTGPSGSGKTRLALEFAATLAAPKILVDLAPINDAHLIAGAIASVLGIREAVGEPLRDTLVRRFGEGENVLVLDNLEQIHDAGLVVADLLTASPGLRVLATSRAPLHVLGEHTFPVEPLERSEAIALFVDRARAIDPRFALTKDDDAAAVTDICARLDGLPLAIELAAARTRFFAPSTLLSRLDQRLSALGRDPWTRPTVSAPCVPRSRGASIS